jgi:hypothetical protein
MYEVALAPRYLIFRNQHQEGFRVSIEARTRLDADEHEDEALRTGILAELGRKLGLGPEPAGA